MSGLGTSGERPAGWTFSRRGPEAEGSGSAAHLLWAPRPALVHTLPTGLPGQARRVPTRLLHFGE